MLRFLTPIAFTGLALALPIILLYLLKLRRRETPVSSNFLWQQVLQDAEANTPGSACAATSSCSCNC